MDYTRGGAYPGSSAIAIIPDANPPDWPAAASDSSDQHLHKHTRNNNEINSNSNPSNPASASASASSRSKAIGRMFFKTKLCCKFRAGNCPYPTNCNFASGLEELRKPPPNWEEIVAAHSSEASAESAVITIPREEHQIPTVVTDAGDGEGQRSYKGRHCKKFYTEEGCPYGDMCTFLHDEQSRVRESVAISLSPVVGGGGVHESVAGSAGGIQKPSNWKTRICNKWEMTGYCLFGSKCHFAHGAAELHRYGGGLAEADGKDASSTTSDSKQVGMFSKAQTDTAVGSTVVPHVDAYHMGVPLQRSALINPRQGQRPIQKWKGPDKISRIYGDWIHDIE